MLQASHRLVSRALVLLAMSMAPLASEAQRVNLALPANGGSASASSEVASPSLANDGVLSWAAGAGYNTWKDDTPDVYPDWLQIGFDGLKAVDEVAVYSVRDNYTDPSTPPDTETGGAYVLTSFEVQYLSGSTWVNVPGGQVTSNNLVVKRLAFSPVTTNAVRVLIHAANGGGYSRVVELQAFGNPQPRTNVALAANGGLASASSQLSSPGLAIDGVLSWAVGGGNTWKDSTPDVWGDWLQVTFQGSKTIDEISVYGVRDNYTDPSDPGATETGSLYNLVAFEAQYWNGSAWVTVPNGNITGNNLIVIKITFPAVTTSQVRVLVHNANGGGYSRIVELQAWTSSGEPANQAPSVTGFSASGTQFTAPASFTLNASATDPDGSVARVDFYRGSETAPFTQDTSAPFSASLSGLAAGTYTYYAKAVDNLGAASAASSTVTVTVNAAGNQLPTITSFNASGTQFTALASFTLNASATDADGSVARVDFYRGNETQPFAQDASAPYSAALSGVAAGTYTYHAKAVDNLGAISAASSTVTVTVSEGGNPQPRTNVALAANGGLAGASSQISSPGLAIDGVLSWAVGDGNTWKDSTPDVWGDWLQVTFQGSKTIDEISVYGVRDNYTDPSDPGATETGSFYNLVAFEAQYWNGSAWVTVPNGNITGNNLIVIKITFPAVTTSQVRVLVHNANGGGYSRIVELQAWTSSGQPANQAPSVTGFSASGTQFTAPASFTLNASATDPDGSVARVDFYRGSETQPFAQDASAPYSATLSGVAAGTYTYYAKAVDNLGAVSAASSAGVSVTVAAAPTPVSTVAGQPVAFPAIIGPIIFTADAKVTSLKIQVPNSSSTIELVRDGAYAPFRVGPKWLPADQIVSGTTTGGGAATLAVSSPNGQFQVNVAPLGIGNLVKFTIVSAPAGMGVDVRFVAPTTFECQLGNPEFVDLHHSCSSTATATASDPVGTMASFCVDGNCNNSLDYGDIESQKKARHLVNPKVGARLERRPALDFENRAAMLLFLSPHAYRTLEFARDFEVFRKANGSEPNANNTMFVHRLTACPNSDPLCVAGATAVGQRAQAMGFDDIMIEQAGWSRTSGIFDPYDTDKLRDVIAELSASSGGKCTILHELASDLTDANPLCTPDRAGLGLTPPTDCEWRNAFCPNNQFGAPVQTLESRRPSCPPQGRPEQILPRINGYGSGYLWNESDRQVFNHVVNSKFSSTSGLPFVGACGYYADGSDWFTNGVDFIAAFSQGLPASVPKFRAAISPSANALHLWDGDLTDTFQIRLSRKVRDWVFNFGYENMLAFQEHLGILGRMGWISPPELEGPLYQRPSASAPVPPTRPEDSEADYLPILNAAVAAGAPLTLAANADAPAYTASNFSWFRNALPQINSAIRTIRANGSIGVSVHRSAEYDVTHFSNGVSTVAFFDMLVNKGQGLILARNRGVNIVSDCGAPFTSCFRFRGGKRVPTLEDALVDIHTTQLTQLPDSGSILFAPRTLTGATSWTVSLWFKRFSDPDGGATGGSASLLEKGPWGYGIYIDAQNYVSGHASSSQRGSWPQGIGAQVDYPEAWNHYAHVYKMTAAGPEIRTFLNGSLVAVGGDLSKRPYDVWAASPVIVGDGFNGWMNDIRAYHRALSDADVSELYGRRAPNGGGPEFAWSAENANPETLPDINIELGSQRTVFLVPMLDERHYLPNRLVRLRYVKANGSPGELVISTWQLTMNGHGHVVNRLPVRIDLPQ